MSDDDMADERRSATRGKSRSSRADSNSNSNSSSNNKDKDKGRSKGRGFQRSFEGDQERYLGKAGQFESLEDTGDTDAQPSVEGWIVIATNIHEEAQEDDLYELFADYGEIKQIHLNLDRRTGYVKGYSLIEFETFREAKAAIDALNGKTLLDKPLTVDWAFKKPAGSGRRDRRSGAGSSSQSSSNSRRSREVRKRGEQHDEDDE